MTDVLTAEQRSRNMSAIRSRNTEPEMVVRRFLHAAGCRYRLHGNKLPGRPDIVLSRSRIVVFVHGCFWHRHTGCQYASMPRTNRTFWRKKFNGNVARDIRHHGALTADGWSVLTIWECETRSRPLLAALLRKIRRIYRGRSGA